MAELQKFKAVAERLINEVFFGQTGKSVWQLVDDWSVDPATGAERHDVAMELALAECKIPLAGAVHHLEQFGSETVSMQNMETIFLRSALNVELAAGLKLGLEDAANEAAASDAP